MSDRPHSLLVTHSALPFSATHGQMLWGYAPQGCLACAEGPPPRCWCGGEVGTRVPGDSIGLGCLAVIAHEWRADTTSEREQAIADIMGKTGQTREQVEAVLALTT